jgi:hypothetical protein
MANTPNPPSEPADYLDMPDARRTAAKAHASLLGATARSVALTLPLSADVDDFRRVLIAHAPKGKTL